eukprot:m.189365 g.189365  ORF g.189365 m.189365 type:complete len:152 (+) comp15628_c1_seq1:153-608(+)
MAERQQIFPSSVIAVRLHPGEELTEGIIAAVKNANVKSAWIQTCVGSLKSARLRLANATAGNKNEIRVFDERMEILSLVGTIDAGGSGKHMHISLGNKDGQVYGGHVMSDCIVFTTAEIVLGVSHSMEFSREMDITTGFHELCIKKATSEK